MSTKIVGLVLSGGGARGAYEAGALSVLLPDMAAHGLPPTRLVGTSAGALNVVALAGLAHHGWSAATEKLADAWSTLRFAEVADVPTSAARDVASYLAQVFGANARLVSLLDTRRMRQTLNHRLPLADMHNNVRSGVIEAVAIAATSFATDGTVVFVEAGPGVRLPRFDAKRNIRYVATEITVDHVLASAAVPVAFRPVHLQGSGWYSDGGVRLNTPLKPAIELGCDHLAVVATHPRTWKNPEKQTGTDTEQPPDVFESASLVLKAVLVDHMLEDLRTLVKINAVARAAPSTGYRPVCVKFAGPSADEVHAIADAARRVRLDPLADQDLWLLERLLGGPAGERAELLSFLLFHPKFTRALIRLGAEHAEKATRWQTVL
jgi:NTE family protein